jgi:hypothetical protein
MLSLEPKSFVSNPFPLYESIAPVAIKGIDLEKFHLLLPAEAASGSVHEWEKSLLNAKCLLEYSNSRILDIESLNSRGKDAFVKKVLYLKQLLQIKQDELLERKKKIQTVNISRQEATKEVSSLLFSYKKKYKKTLLDVEKLKREIQSMESLHEHQHEEH